MIKKDQYFRLTIVLLLPLLAIGWLLWKHQIIFDRHEAITCSDRGEEFSCMRMVSKDYLTYSRGVSIFGAYFPGGFSHQVMDLGDIDKYGMITIGRESAKTARKISGEGYERHLYFPAAYTREFYWSCSMAPVIGSQESWAFTCTGDIDLFAGVFYFKNKADDLKYKNIRSKVSVLEADSRKYQIIIFSISLALPIISYLLFSLLFPLIFFLTVKIYKYVMYGLNKKTV